MTIQEIKQKIFNKVASHLLTQGEKSLSNNGLCSYRGEEGKMCAIGCLIPKSRYKRTLEGKAAVLPVIKAIFPRNHMRAERLLGVFLRDLQIIHDSYNEAIWKSELQYFAETNRLDASILSAFEE